MATPYLRVSEELREAVHRMAVDRGYMLGEVEIHFLDGARQFSFVGLPREGEVRAVVRFERMGE